MNRRILLQHMVVALGAPLFGATTLQAGTAFIPASLPEFEHPRNPQPEPETSMLIVRDVFQCKPGHAKYLADIFKKALPLMEKEEGFRNGRVMVDYSASYWTVVLETECDDISAFERHMQNYGKDAEIQQVMTGYMDHVVGGSREIFRVW